MNKEIILKSGQVVIESGPSATDWIQTAATILGIAAATWLALRISKLEHQRQVTHQTRHDVAQVVNILGSMYPVFEAGELHEHFPESDPRSDEPGNLEGANALMRSLFAELQNVTNVLRLTASKATYEAADNLLGAVSEFYNELSKVVMRESLARTPDIAEEAPFSKLRDKIRNCESELISLTMDQNDQQKADDKKIVRRSMRIRR